MAMSVGAFFLAFYGNVQWVEGLGWDPRQLLDNCSHLKCDDRISSQGTILKY